MAISSIIPMFNGGTPRLGAIERQNRLRLQAGDGANRDPSNQRQYAAPVASQAPAVNSPGVSTPPASRTDQLDLSSLLFGNGNAQPTDASGTPDDTQTDPSQDPNQSQTTTDGGAIVESFIRRRAILAYHSPQLAGGGSFDFTLDLEVAYRVIQFVPAGGTIDLKG